MLTIIQGRTSFMFRVEDNHQRSNYILSKVFDLLKDFEYDRESRRYKLSNYYYRHDPRQSVGILPISVLPELLTQARQNQIQCNITIAQPVEPTTPTGIVMKPGWTDKPIQVGAIRHLVTPFDPEDLYSSMRCLALQTGKGKTYTGIKSAVLLGHPTLIIASGLLDQWKQAWLDQTTVDEDDIYIIRGYASIDNLLKSNYHPKVIIASLETMREFTQRKGTYSSFPWDMNDLVLHCQIGTKIIDEVHLNFHAIVQLDLVSNIKHNFYLSATYGRSNKTTAKVFEVIYPNDRRYGDDLYTKYVDVQTVNFNLWVPVKFISFGGNYSHFKYEQYVYKNPRAKEQIFKFWRFLINHRYAGHRQPGDRLLIYVAKVETSLIIAEWMRGEYPELDIRTYTQKDPDDNLTADVIITTPKSAGVGTDIDQLLAVINSVSIKSETMVEQMLGRLRELPGGRTPMYTDQCNRTVPAQIEHADERNYIYRKLSKTFSIHNY